MKCDSWAAIGVLGVCLTVAGCSSAPKSAPSQALLAPVNPTCGLAPSPNGELGSRRLYADLPEGVHPDGIALDAEGAVWLANPEGEYGVLRVREGGEILERIDEKGMTN